MTEALVERLRAHQRAGDLDLAPIGDGQTSSRWRALLELAREDLSVARFAEAHVDAHQILREAGHHPTEGAVYGVWASDSPRWRSWGRTQGTDGPLRLRGSKAFCTGAGLIDRTLITVHPDGDEDLGQPWLVDLDLRTVTEDRIDRSGWRTPALADTSTAVVDLNGLTVDSQQVIGGAGWYLSRPGFWDGAVGPAACWAGGAVGLVDHVVAHPPSDPHGRAHLGALSALAWNLEAVLDRAGREMDMSRRDQAAMGERRASEASAGDRARRRALTVRHLVDVACAEVAERFARALGPRPLVTDGGIIERDRALALYRRQCHGERDLETLGRLTVPDSRQ